MTDCHGLRLDALFFHLASPPDLICTRRIIVDLGFLKFGCSWVRVLLREEAGSGAGAVPADGRQEVAVLQGGRPGLQVLRAPHAPRPQPFKKACGNAARRHAPLPLPLP
uniref:Uncharacterized protein n=1 Tax=Aegilops tauschii subsp. strangulata TaxID=200361 RepID=A0A453CUH7_AEGTS